MSPVPLEGNQLSPSAATAWPQRLLEGPRGVGLYFSTELLGLAQGPVRRWECEEGGFDFILWHLPHFTWARAQALKLLQGATLQQLLGPRYAVVDLQTRPPFSPLPGLDNLFLAEGKSFTEADVGRFMAMLLTQVRPVLPQLG